MSTQPPSAASTQPPHALPITTIQPTFLTVLNEIYTGLIPSDKFWVSCYHPLHPSMHAKISGELDDVDRGKVVLSTDEGVEVKWDGQYTVTSPISPPTKIHMPIQEYTIQSPSSHKTLARITAFDTSPDNTQCATGYLDGTLLLTPTSPLPTSSSSTPKEYTTPSQVSPQSTHATLVNGVSDLQFFPSSRVLLASAGDFSLNILPADLPSPSSSQKKIDIVQTMRGHTRPITSLGIIGVGRNILSTALDGTVKLWDVPSASVITSIKASAAITSSTIGSRGSFPLAESERDPREVGEVNDTIVFSGLKNGSFTLFDLASKSPVFSSNATGGASIDAVTYSSPHNLLATGSESGLVTIYDVRSLFSPVSSFYRSKAGILDLQFLSKFFRGGRDEVGNYDCRRPSIHRFYPSFLFGGERECEGKRGWGACRRGLRSCAAYQSKRRGRKGGVV